MYGRRNRNSFFYYPTGGINQGQYPMPNGYEGYIRRQQPSPIYPVPYPPLQGNQNWYQPQQPFNMNANYFPNAYPNNNNNINSYAGHPNMMNQDFSQSVFQNPLQPEEESYPPYYPQQMMNQTGVNQYPNQTLMPKQPSGIHSIMNSFKSQDGSVDMTKMVNTAGQMMNAVTQVSSMVKGLGGMFKP